MALRPSLRAQGKVSFFVFQDIITAVTGIVIIIALILALNINEAIPDSASPQKTEVTLPQSIEELQSKIKTLETKSTHLGKLAQTLTPISSLQTEIENLQLKIVNAQSMMASKKNEIDSGETHQTLLQNSILSHRKLTTLQQELSQAKKQTQILLKNAQTIEALVQKIETRKQDAIQAQKHVLTFVPDKTKNNKQAIILIMSGEDITLSQFGNSDPVHFASTDLPKVLSKYSPQNYFIVILIRPSCAEAFEPLKLKVKTLGYEVGYEPISEDSKVKLITPTQP